MCGDVPKNEKLVVPKVGQWVVYVGKGTLVTSHMKLGDISPGTLGIMLDFTDGGPEYPPCFMVAWKVVDKAAEEDGAVGYSFRIAKHKPEEIELYDRFFQDVK